MKIANVINVRSLELVLLTLLISGFILLGLVIGKYQLYPRFLNSMSLQQVIVEGRVNTPLESIEAALRIDKALPIVKWDMHAALPRVEEIPWVKSARLRRDLATGTVHVRLAERTPVSIWQANRQSHLMDEDGKIIPVPLAGFGHLPVLVGEGAPAQLGRLMEMLESAPEVKSRLVAATWMGRRRWRLVLDSITRGTTVDLPEAEPEKALAALNDMIIQYNVANPAIARIDMRLRDRIVFNIRRAR
ncbi:MAG: cell division protein FtsQ/DivIB [Alphaproteobacteria bacterium]|nr:cell division protein FtsQ/DivIB [Alphaproteobacteria bacterium]